MPEVLAAASALADAGIGADVVCLTSADRVFRDLRASRGVGEGEGSILDELFAADRAAPLVTVLDGHPHTLSFLSTIHGQPLTALGVDDFGQSGEIADLYSHFGIDADSIIEAAADAIS
jgi:pyruvate dehydrogenase E1 component